MNHLPDKSSGKSFAAVDLSFIARDHCGILTLES